MNRNMRLAIDSMIERKVISANLLFLCLARLNEIIMTRAANNTKQEQQRVIIAKAALSIGVDKETIRDKMKSIDQSCFPTDRKITEICEYIESGYCGIDDSAIPDRWLKYKSAEQIEHDMQRQQAKREKQQTSRSTFDCSDPDFIELCDYLNTEIISELFSYPMTEPMKKRLQSLETSNFDYSVILKCFQWYKRDIVKAMKSKETSKDPFKSDFAKFCYMCGTVEKYLPATKKEIDDQEWQKQRDEEWIAQYTAQYAERLNHKSAEYQRKTEEPPPGFENYW